MSRSTGSTRIPKYRLHSPSGLAVARFNGVDFYLGKHGSQESRDEYDRLLGEWMMKGRQAPAKTVRIQAGQMSVNELILAYLQFADGYYRKNGQPTGEYDSIRNSLKPLRRLYGSVGVGEFGPLALKNVRESMIKSGLCRSEINKRVGRMVRMFKWGVEIAPECLQNHQSHQQSWLSAGRQRSQAGILETRSEDQGGANSQMAFCDLPSFILDKSTGPSYRSSTIGMRGGFYGKTTRQKEVVL